MRRGGANGHAGHAHDGGGVRALAADITQRDAPRAPAGVEHVVEVAAHLVLGEGEVPRLQLDPGDVGEAGR